MKKSTIWVIAVVMAFSLLGLLFLQLSYIEDMTQMKREQFDESVNRSLYQAARNIELTETLRYLEANAGDDINNDVSGDADDNAGEYSAFTLKTISKSPSSVPKALILRASDNVAGADKTLQDAVRNRYVYQRALLDEVIYNVLYVASDVPLDKRVNFRALDRDIRTELLNNGVSLPYHFSVSTSDGREVYRCPDYTDDGIEHSYSHVIFHNDPASKMGVVTIHFPGMDRYIISSVRFFLPSIAFTTVLLITFLLTLLLIFRQKRYAEVKNDFINNMTHELKTPIASISLAAQMLNDESVTKSPNMMKHLGGVINDESKRLRFLVEKVLQMSMFDRKSAVLKKRELNINELVDNAANSFSLRVEHTGGKIYTQNEAVNPMIYADETHFQNVIFNLMDNAVKYCDPSRPLDIYMKTWNDGAHVFLSIRDTGIGIRKDNLKKIFEKFYRVHTGDVHDVKGFGLGLAYVKKMVNIHGGDIRVESEYGRGTTFTLSLPTIKRAKDEPAEDVTQQTDGSAGNDGSAATPTDEHQSTI